MCYGGLVLGYEGAVEGEDVFWGGRGAQGGHVVVSGGLEGLHFVCCGCWSGEDQLWKEMSSRSVESWTVGE